MVNKTNHIKYYQCPYCNHHENEMGKRVPKTIGKYRIKLENANVLAFKCSKCSGVFKIEISPNKYLWQYMNTKEQNLFKKGKRRIKKSDKKIQIS